MALLIHARSPLTEAALDDADRRATILVLAGDALAGLDARCCERLLARRSLFVAIVEGNLGAPGLAAALDSDWLAVREGSFLPLSFPAIDPVVASSLARRVGNARARRLLLIGERKLSGAAAFTAGVADSLVPAEEDSLKWLHGWLSARSARALLAGAGLVRRRGGDALERAEFARLFSEGVPRRGLRMFLDKKTLDFSDDLEVVTI
jgi:enoyl-CoA hydratase/carnithine racemase